MIYLTSIDRRVYREKEKRVVLGPPWMLLGDIRKKAIFIWFSPLLTLICYVYYSTSSSSTCLFIFLRPLFFGMHPLSINNARLHQFQFVCVCVCVRAFSSPFPSPHWLWSNIPSELEKYCIGPCSARTRRVGVALFWFQVGWWQSAAVHASKLLVPTSVHVYFYFFPLFLITIFSTITMESNKVCARALFFFFSICPSFIFQFVIT